MTRASLLATSRCTLPVGPLPLPWPPSLNHYWRHVGSRVLISLEGRIYRRTVGRYVLAHFVGRPPLFSGRLAVHIAAFPPDRRARDVDNLAKSALDALTHAGLWLDDSQIDRLIVERMPAMAGGVLHVTVDAMAYREGE